jgi:hypothetical protein
LRRDLRRIGRLTEANGQGQGRFGESTPGPGEIATSLPPLAFQSPFASEVYVAIASSPAWAVTIAWKSTLVCDAASLPASDPYLSHRRTSHRLPSDFASRRAPLPFNSHSPGWECRENSPEFRYFALPSTGCLVNRRPNKPCGRTIPQDSHRSHQPTSRVTPRPAVPTCWQNGQRIGTNNWR